MQLLTNPSQTLDLPSAPRHYQLTCRSCCARFDDDGVRLHCPDDHPRALLQVTYSEDHLTVEPAASGVFRYQRWLPVSRNRPSSARPLVYRSDLLSRDFALAELWVSFSGYWPERGVLFETGTFKELEAETVLARLPEDFRGVLTVASAGNTAAAFARACSKESVPCLLVVPESALGALRFAGPLGKTVRLVVLSPPSDYSDAIDLA
ncbi:MAG TPA: pyridoxal-phosphate dependent enzyme, partial [Bryobacteraceae bacterium]|nr:pyridoxal-phosphate dependent enzyme [Bryobacteraceae bacterium]